MIQISTERLNNELNKEITRVERLKAMKAKCDEILPSILQHLEPLINKRRIQISGTPLYFSDMPSNSNYSSNRIAIRAALKFENQYGSWDSAKVKKFNEKFKQLLIPVEVYVYTNGLEISILFDSEKLKI